MKRQQSDRDTLFVSFDFVERVRIDFLSINKRKQFCKKKNTETKKMTDCQACDRFRQYQAIRLRTLGVADLERNRAQCHACFESKLQKCQTYKNDMEQFQGNDPTLNLSPLEIKKNWHKCLWTTDPYYKTRQELDKEIAKRKAQRLQANINVLNLFKGGSFSSHPSPPPAKKVEKKRQRSLSPRSRYDESKFVSYDKKYMTLTKVQLSDLLRTVGVHGVSARSKAELCSMATFFRLSTFIPAKASVPYSTSQSRPLLLHKHKFPSKIVSYKTSKTDEDVRPAFYRSPEQEKKLLSLSSKTLMSGIRRQQQDDRKYNVVSGDNSRIADIDSILSQLWELTSSATYAKENKLVYIVQDQTKLIKPEMIMTEKEMMLVHEYEQNSDTFNHELRHPSWRGSQLSWQTHALQNLLLRAPSWNQPLLVYRGISVHDPLKESDADHDVNHPWWEAATMGIAIDKFCRQFKIGQSYSPPGFQSFTLNMRVAKEFASGVMILGLIPEGSPAFPLPPMIVARDGNESEILMPHGTRWVFLYEIKDTTLLRPYKSLFYPYDRMTRLDIKSPSKGRPDRMRALLFLIIPPPKLEKDNHLTFFEIRGANWLNRPIIRRSASSPSSTKKLNTTKLRKQRSSI
jgi:hypothetical protein